MWLVATVQGSAALDPGTPGTAENRDGLSYWVMEIK